MKFFKKSTPKEIVITKENISQWPIFEKKLNNGKVKFDNKGVLRYLHGAPVGNLISTGKRQDGTPIYKESAKEWFDPNSEKASNFKWPESQH